MAWSAEELNILLEYYQTSHKDALLQLLPGKTINQIWSKAHSLKLKKLVNSGITNGDISVLLQDTPEAYYWIGFLLADGWFVKPGRIGLRVAEKDLEHLTKYSEFIGNTTGLKRKVNKGGFRPDKPQYEVSASSNYYYKQIVQKFDISSTKTYNPPELSRVLAKADTTLIIALIIGFIDGDGCISSVTDMNNQIQINVDASWLANLQWFSNQVYKYADAGQPTQATIDTTGLAKLVISKRKVLQTLKAAAVTLPSLSRKWDSIKTILSDIPAVNNAL